MSLSIYQRRTILKLILSCVFAALVAFLVVNASSNGNKLTPSTEHDVGGEGVESDSSDVEELDFFPVRVDSDSLPVPFDRRSSMVCFRFEDEQGELYAEPVLPEESDNASLDGSFCWFTLG